MFWPKKFLFCNNLLLYSTDNIYRVIGRFYPFCYIYVIYNIDKYYRKMITKFNTRYSWFINYNENILTGLLVLCKIRKRMKLFFNEKLKIKCPYTTFFLRKILVIHSNI